MQYKGLTVAAIALAGAASAFGDSAYTDEQDV